MVTSFKEMNSKISFGLYPSSGLFLTFLLREITSLILPCLIRETNSASVSDSKSFFRALSTYVHVLVLSKSRTTNLSIMPMVFSGISSGASPSDSSASVSSGSDFQVDHAVFFPCPAKLETVSQPVKAWNIGSAHAILGPRLAAILCAAK